VSEARFRITSGSAAPLAAATPAGALVGAKRFGDRMTELVSTTWFARLPVDGRYARYVPVASALVISVAGLLIVANALSQTGLLGAGT